MNEFFFSKKGQIALFVIIGFIILIGVGIYLIMFTDLQEKESQKQMQEVVLTNGIVTTTTLDTIIQNCMRTVFSDEIKDVLGNHFFFQSNQLVIDSIPYYYFLGKNTFPQKKIFEVRYAQYKKNELLSCIDNFKSLDNFLTRELVYDANIVNLKVDFGEDTMYVRTETGAYFRDEAGNLEQQQEVVYQKPSNVGVIYNGIDLLLNPTQKEGFFYEQGLSYLAKNGFYTTISAANRGELLFFITDQDIPEEEEALNYVFAFKAITTNDWLSLVNI